MTLFDATDFDFEGAAAFVTGAASGIGRACALAFGAAGARVAVADLNNAGGQETVAMITAAGGAAAFFSCDVTSEDSVAAAVDGCVATFGGLHAAANVAGIGETRPALTAEFDVAAFDQVVAVNLRGVFLSMRSELRQMVEQGSGAIVNVSSGAGLVGVSSAPAYVAAKHGVIGLTRTGALDYAKQGIRVNAICPGVTATPLIGDISPEMLPTGPMARLARPEEMANAMLWLCSAGASFVNGVALPVDGGYVAE